MKKIIVILLMVVVILSNAGFAELQPSELFVKTEEVDSDVKDFALNQLAPFIADLYGDSKIRVSSPFVVNGVEAKLYYFILFSENKVIGTYRVFEDAGEYHGIFSEDPSLNERIERVIMLTSLDSPASFIGTEDGLFALVDGDVHLLSDDREDKSEDNRYLLDRVLKEVELEKESIDNHLDLAKNISSDNLLISTDYRLIDSKALSLDMAEIQPSNSRLCLAYASNSVARYITNTGINDISVAGFVNAMGGHIATADLGNMRDYYISVFGYSIINTLPFKDVRVTGSAQMYQKIKYDIDRNKPVLISAHEMHALVCAGYFKYAVPRYGHDEYSYYRIWDPFYRSYQVMSYHTRTYVSHSANRRYRAAYLHTNTR